MGCIEQRRVITFGSTLDAFLTRTKKKKIEEEEEGKQERGDRDEKKK